MARAMTRAAAPATPHPAAAHQPGILGEDGRGAGHETGQGADVGLQHSTAKALDPAAGVSDGSGGAGGTGDAGAGGGGEAGGGAVSQPVSGLSAAEAAAALEAEEVADVREQVRVMLPLVYFLLLVCETGASCTYSCVLWAWCASACAEVVCKCRWVH